MGKGKIVVPSSAFLPFMPGLLSSFPLAQLFSIISEVPSHAKCIQHPPQTLHPN